MTVPRAQGVPNRAQGTLARNCAHVPRDIYGGTGHTCLTRRNAETARRRKGTPETADIQPTVPKVLPRDLGLEAFISRTNPRATAPGDQGRLALSTRCRGLFPHALTCTAVTVRGLCDKRRAR